MPESDPWDFSEYTQNSPTDKAAASGPDHALSPDAHQDLFGSARSAASTEPAWSFGGTETVATAPLSIARPPVTWLACCAAITVIGGILALTLGSLPPVAIVAWVLCGPMAIGLLALFTSRDTHQRSLPVYAAAGWVKPAYIACLVLCGAAVLISAIRIALWVGRL